MLLSSLKLTKSSDVIKNLIEIKLDKNISSPYNIYYIFDTLLEVGPNIIPVDLMNEKSMLNIFNIYINSMIGEDMIINLIIINYYLDCFKITNIYFKLISYLEDKYSTTLEFLEIIMTWENFLLV